MGCSKHQQKVVLPAIGTTMYHVLEQFYRDESISAAPLRRYIICSGELTGFNTGGYAEVRIVGKSPDGYRTPYYYQTKDIGKRLFYSYAEAEPLLVAMNKGGIR